jgi:prephenate dehydrogenase
LVIVCTPIASVVEHVRQAAEACGPRTVITDVGSTKAAIVAGAEQALAGREGVWASFVGSHPLAGSEKTGVEFARDDLFEGRTVAVTPTENTRPDAADKIEGFWQSLGARTLRMSPEAHDKAVAVTSHLPHLIAAAMAAITPIDDLPLTGPGWRDTTRIAGGDVQLWQQILADNRVHTLSALAQFERLLSEYRQALETSDGPAIARLLAQGKSIRDALGS